MKRSSLQNAWLNLIQIVLKDQGPDVLKSHIDKIFFFSFNRIFF